MKSLIRKYRKQKGLTQKDLATAIGRSRSVVAGYELGITGMPIPVLWKIARCLDVKVDMLYEDEPIFTSQGHLHGSDQC